MAPSKGELDMNTPHGTQITPHLYRVVWWDIAGKDVVNCDVYAVNCGESVVLIDSGRGGPSYPMMKANLVHFATIDSVRYAFTGDLVMPNGTIGYSGSFDFDSDNSSGASPVSCSGSLTPSSLDTCYGPPNRKGSGCRMAGAT